MRKLKKVPFFLDIEFDDFISQDQIKEVAEKVMLALNDAIDSGGGLAPEGRTYTNKVRLMCKDVILITEDHTQMREDGSRVIDIQEIKGVVVQDPSEEKLDEAVGLLKNILCESGQECEYDKDIYKFLKENNELPEDYEPYWDEEDEEE